MGSLPVAFSVHNFISSVGADAGFAAIIGLAILVLLYFAHARETANLREEAALLAARLQQAEARVAELSRPQPVAVPAAESVQVTDQRGVLGPFAPAGTAAPALASATRVVPLAVPPEPLSSDPAPALPAVAVGAAPVAAVSSVTAPVRSPAPISVESPVAPAPTASPAASTAAPAASPVARSAAPAASPAAPSAVPPAPEGPAMPGPATAAGANGGGQGPSRSLSAGSPPGTSPPGVIARPARQLPPLGPPVSSGRSSARRIVLAVVGLLLVAAAAVALVVITNNNGSSSPTTHPRTTNAPASKQASVFSPSTVTVAVLNGTSTNQLAHHVAAKLAAGGYREGRIATAANQTLTASIVAYLPGAKNRTDALHVAKALKLRATAVHPIDSGTQQVACPPPGACNANVVVTVGADLATL